MRLSFLPKTHVSFWKYVCCLLLVVFACISTAKSSRKVAESEYQLAVEAVQNKSYEQALKHLNAAADKGHIDAMNDLGLLYESGIIVDQNYNSAMNWYLRAAKKSHPPAMFNIGLLHYKGLGVAQNFKEAQSWFLRAANLGDVDAQYNVGVLYHKGEGVRKDDREAYIWFAIAAYGGSKRAIDARNQMALTLGIAALQEANASAQKHYNEIQSKIRKK